MEESKQEYRLRTKAYRNRLHLRIWQTKTPKYELTTWHRTEPKLLFSTNNVKEMEDQLSMLTEPRIGTYTHTVGDLVRSAKNGEFDIIIHGCNCFATFGAGIAPQIGKAFPNAKEADQNLPLTGIQRLGNFSYGVANVGNSGKQVMVVNAYTQYMPGPDFQLEALAIALRKLAMYLEEKFGPTKAKELTIALPLIGCGIGGGHWPDVQSVIQSELTEYDVTTIKWEKDV